MASITIRDLDESLKARLRIQAAQNGRSMEEEARQILHRALAGTTQDTGLGSKVAQRFFAVGGIEDLALPRSRPRDAPDFDAAA